MITSDPAGMFTNGGFRTYRMDMFIIELDGILNMAIYTHTLSEQA
jgi:hypothetical protein